MAYNPFFGERKTKIVHPYVLKEYNNRWFLLCYSEDYKTEGIYALDRISELERIEKKYRNPDKNLINTYFSEIIGVTNIKEEPVQEIILKLTKYRASYLRTKPIHTSQKIVRENEDYIWFSFSLKINNELIALILGFGMDIKVDKPIQLAEQLKKIYQAAFNQYI
jgi:predicted DNA-binding transcriptional regulator YafY